MNDTGEFWSLEEVTMTATVPAIEDNMRDPEVVVYSEGESSSITEEAGQALAIVEHAVGEASKIDPEAADVSSINHPLSSSSSSSSGAAEKALPIVTVRTTTNNTETGRALHLSTDFQKIIEQCQDPATRTDYPLAIISLSGECQKENAIIMKYIVRYLEKIEQTGTGGTDDWVQVKSDRIPADVNSFPFVAETSQEGIWMWSRPFLIPNPQDPSKTIAVLLMNTGGCFEDSILSDDEKQALFGLTILTASTFIFCVSSKLNGNTLATLHKFMERGHLAMSLEFEGKSYQDVMFLITDWSNPATYGYGTTGGQAYIDEFLKIKPGMNPEAAERRECIRESCDSITGCLLPHPGHEFLVSISGSSEHMKPEFRNHLAQLVSHIVSNVRPQKILSGFATPGFLHMLFTSYLKAFNEPDLVSMTRQSLPTPTNENIPAEEAAEIKALAKSYEGILRRKIAKKSVPFIVPEKLLKWHEEAKFTFVSVLQNKQQNPDDRASALTQKLEEAIDEIYSGILAENNQAMDDLTTQAHKVILDRFTNFLEQITSRDRYWTRSNFDQLVIPEKNNSILEFRQVLSQAPAAAVETHVENLKQDLQIAEDSVWTQLDSRRCEAESSMEKIITECVALYREKMDTFCDGEAMPTALLKTVGAKRIQLALDHFENQIGGKFTDEIFVKEFRGKLEALLDTSFKDYERQNSDKLQIFASQMEMEINVAIGVFKSEASDLPVGNNVEVELKEIHSEILSSCAQVLDESECPDTSTLRKYKLELKQRLNDALEEAVAAMINSTQAMRIRCDEILRSAENQVTIELNALLGPSEFLDPPTFDEQARRIGNAVVKSNQSKLEQVGVADCQDFLRRLKEFAAHEVERVIQINLERKTKSEKIMENLGTFTNLYCEAMESSLTSFDNFEELTAKHEELTSQYLIQFSRQLAQLHIPCTEDYTQRLQTEFQVLHESFQQNLEDYQKLMKSLKKLARALENDLDPIVLENPFVLDSQIDSLANERIQKFKNDGLEMIYRVFPSDTAIFQESAQVLRDLEDRSKEALKIRAEQARKSQDAATERIILECTHSLTELLSARKIQIPPLSLDAAELLFAAFATEVQSQFQQHWTLPYTPKKEEARARIGEKMEVEYDRIRQNIKENIEAYQTAVEMALEETMEEVCRPFQTALSSVSSGKFYRDNGAMVQIIAAARDQAPQIYQEKLSARGIEWNEGFHLAIRNKFDEERAGFLEKNAENENLALENLATFVNDQFSQEESGLKSSVDLQYASQRIVAKAVDFLQRSAAFSLQEHPESLAQVTGLCAQVRTKMLEQLGTGFMRSITSALDAAEKFYRDSMDEGVANKAPMHPDDLAILHQRSQVLALRRLESQHFVPPRGKALVEIHLDTVYKSYRDRNNLKCAEDTNLAVGIDLGTTTTCVAIYRFGEARVLKDQGGRNLTPSYLHISDDGSPIVGHEAKDQANVHNPKDTVYDAKRLIGRPFTDPHIQSDMRMWPFKVVRGSNGESRIILRGKRYKPEEVSAQILRKMVEIAEADLGEKISQAVITVPASFNDRQRDATRQAAQIAGLEVLHIINEPTAAAMAYASNWKSVRKTVLVFDFGGGTLDVSILRSGEDDHEEGEDSASRDDEASSSRNSNAIAVARTRPDSTVDTEVEGTRLRVLTTTGDIHLGGEDFDKRMVEFCAREFEKVHPGIKLLEPEEGRPNSVVEVNKRLRRLKNECEKVKCHLAAANSSSVSLEAIHGDKNLLVKVTRAEFERMNEDLFQRAVKLVRRALRDADLGKEDIDEVLMVGGSSRIPRMKALLQDFFGVPIVNLNQRIDIQEAVARGAAIQACILTGGSAARKLPKVRDVQPFSLGVEVIGGHMSVIIPRNTPIPCRETRSYTTTYRNQTVVDVTIFSGEEAVAAKNLLLGQFSLQGVPAGPAGSQRVDVIMAVDDSGILNVTAQCVANGVEANLVIEENRGRLSEGEIRQLRQRFRP